MSVKIRGTLSKKLCLFLSTPTVIVSGGIIGEINGAEQVAEPVLERSEPINILFKPQYERRESIKITTSPLLAKASLQTTLPSPSLMDNPWFKTLSLDKFVDLRLDTLDYESKLKKQIYLAQKGNIEAQRALWKEVIGGARSPRSIQKGKETLYFLMKMMQEIERHFYTHVIDVCFTTEKISKNSQWRKVVEEVKNEIYSIKEHIKDLIRKPATLITCLHIPLWERNYLSDIMIKNNMISQEYSKSRYLALGNNREIIKHLFTVCRSDKRETPIRLSTLFLELKSFYDPEENFHFYKLAEHLNNNASLFRGNYLKGVHDAQDYLNNLFLVSIGWKG